MSARKIIFFILVLAAGPAQAVTHHVDPGQSIQAFVTAAAAGDTIVVAGGAYPGRIDFQGKALALVAPEGPESTTIVGDGGGSVLTLTGIVGGTTLVRGFTISGGGGTGDGGGLLISGCSPSIVGCIIRDNVASYRGGGVLIQANSAPAFVNCRFLGNGSPRGGAVAVWSGSQPYLVNCAFTGNRADQGGGVYAFDGAAPSIWFSTFAGNTGDSGSALYSYAGPLGADSMVSLYGCILWDNPASDGQAAVRTLYAAYTCAQGGISLSVPGPVIIASDPLLVDADGPDGVYGTPDDDLHLGAGSPCCDRFLGAPVNDLVDLDGDGDVQEALPLDLDLEVRALPSHGRAGYLSDMGPYEYWADCNDNGIKDYIDVMTATSVDCDRNGLPDECQPDPDGDGVPEACENIRNSTRDTWHSRISYAVADAGDGDRITVEPGTYLDCIVLTDKSVRLESTGGPAATTIVGDDCGNDNALHLVSAATSATVIRGFTITGNGFMVGGLRCIESSPTVVDCCFVINGIHTGVILGQSYAHLVNCAVLQDAGYMRGAVSVAGGHPRLDGCTIVDAMGYGVDVAFGQLTVSNSILACAAAGEIQAAYTLHGTLTGEGVVNGAPVLASGYRQGAGSPSIDAGSVALLPADVLDLDGDGDVTEPWPLDINGHKRVLDGDGQAPSAVDMGCDEFVHGAAAVDDVAPPGPLAEPLAVTPNPFNPRATITFALAEPGPVQLRVFDVSGRLVRRLVGGAVLAPGPHQVAWDGRDDAGRHEASGIYFCRLEAAGRRETRRMTLLR